MEEEAFGVDIHVLAGEAHVQNPRSGSANEGKDGWGSLGVDKVVENRTARHLWMKAECWLMTTQWRNRADAGSIQKNKANRSAYRPRRGDGGMVPGNLAY